MGPKAQHLHHLADGALFYQLSGIYHRFHVQPLAVIHHIFTPGFTHFGLGGLQLFQGGERGFVGKIILTCIHHPASKGAALRGNRRSRHQFNLRVAENLILTLCRGSHGEAFEEIRHLCRIGIVDPFQLGSGLQKTVAHTKNMSVIQMGGSKHKLSRFYHQIYLAFGRIVHSVCFLKRHTQSFPPSRGCCFVTR